MSIILPKRPDAETMKMLIKARNFLEHSALHSSMDTEFDIMISIHNLDNSIEYLLKIIIRHLEIEELTNKTINSAEIAQLIGEIQRFLNDHSNVHLPYVNEVKLIRDLRNLVQHAMVLPLKELQSQVTIGFKFFEKCLDKFFGITLEEIRYSTLIANTKIKDILLKAEKNIDEGNFLEAVVDCRNSFEYAGLIYNKYSNQRIQRAPAFIELRDKFPNLYYYMKDIDKKIELNSCKVDMNLYKRFEEYINHIPAEFCADWKSNTVMQRDWDKKDALFCYSFVADVIYKWQSMQMAPLYEIKDIVPYYFFERLNGIAINELMDGCGCKYLYGNNFGELMFIDKSTVDALKKNIVEGQIYVMEHETHKNTTGISKSIELVRIDYLHIELVTNDPAIWEVMLWYTRVPYTYSDINTNRVDVNESDLSYFSNIGIPDDIINEIQKFRESEGIVDTSEKAFFLNSIIEKSSVQCNFDFVSQVLIDKYVN